MSNVVCVALVSLLVAAPGGPAASSAETAATSHTAVRYSAPVDAPLRVVRAFAAPATRYGPGHRGTDLAVPVRGRVRSAADGTVTFAGVVAGRGVIVIVHADGIRTEYEPVRSVVVAGMHVRRGEVIAYVRGTHDRCPPDRCLHWAARRGGTYLDPMSLLEPLGPVRLLPLN
jgi:murein DD-endopeptidase MepM/ murein hydrolase activator NlpD